MHSLLSRPRRPLFFQREISRFQKEYSAFQKFLDEAKAVGSTLEEASFSGGDE
jgi:hypothetical protein